MKQHLILGLFLIAIFGFSCSGVQEFDTSSIKTVKIEEFEQNSDELKNLLENGQEIILKISENSVLPLNISLDIKFLKTTKSDNAVTFAEDVYLYIAKDTLKISPDAKRWADFSDFEAVTELFNIEHGSFSIGFQAKKGESASVNISLTTK